MTQTNTIYVSNSGNDTTGDGSIGNPYATLAKVSSVLTDSTKILLAKGSTFVNDKLTLSNKNNIYVDSYGSGAIPILTGLKSITGWTSLGGNKYSIQDDNFPSEITNVFLGGTRLVCGKTSDKTATDGSDTTLTDSALTDADGYWEGAEIVIKLQQWAWSISRVSDFTSKVFTFPTYYQDEEQGYIYPAAADKEYFLQNHINCLSVNNTWAYDAVTKTIYIYKTALPSDITITYGDDCIYATGSKYITIKNITINGAQQCGIHILLSSNVFIDNVIFNYSGIYSMLLHDIKGLKVTNCTGTEQNTDFLVGYYNTNIVIEDIIVTKCGYDSGATRYMAIPYRGMSGNGINISMSSNLVMRYIHVSYCAYSGIWFPYINTFLIENTYVHHFNLSKTDGGGIYSGGNPRANVPISARELYAESGGRIIASIVINTGSSIGIYSDYRMQDVEITRNFVAGCSSNIFLSNSALINIHDNILYADNGTVADFSLGLNEVWSLNNQFKNNLIVNKTTSTASIKPLTSTVRAESFNGNKYYYPFGKVGTGTDNTMFKIQTTWYDLAAWIADESRVAWGRTALNEIEITPSLYAGSSKPATDFLIYLTNPAKTIRTVTSAELPYDDYLDMDGIAQTYPFTMQPYTAKVLVRPN